MANPEGVRTTDEPSGVVEGPQYSLPNQDTLLGEVGLQPNPEPGKWCQDTLVKGGAE
jgi:hypothetical protein